MGLDPEYSVGQFNAEIAKMSQGSHSNGKRGMVLDVFAAAGDSGARRALPIQTDAERRRSLDDIRTLSEEIKFERARAGLRTPV